MLTGVEPYADVGTKPLRAIPSARVTLLVDEKTRGAKRVSRPPGLATGRLGAPPGAGALPHGVRLVQRQAHAAGTNGVPEP